jgi:uncharacterized protein (TIGR02271 family)
MIDESQAQELIGSNAYAEDGSKLGKIGQVFLDDESGRPEFFTVNTGLFGTSESFVPVAGATRDGDSLRVPYTKDQVKDAPNVEIDGRHLDESEEERLYAHYQMADHEGVAADARETGSGDGRVTSQGRDTSGPSTDDAMTRSEERVRVGTTTQEAGRARLRKYVTTEMETHTVPVRKERAVVEREPITDGNVDAATDGPDISEEEHEVVLREERPVVEKTTEPVERVRLGTESTTEETSVTEEVRKEHVETEGDIDRAG